MSPTSRAVFPSLFHFRLFCNVVKYSKLHRFQNSEISRFKNLHHLRGVSSSSLRLKGEIVGGTVRYRISFPLTSMAALSTVSLFGSSDALMRGLELRIASMSQTSVASSSYFKTLLPIVFLGWRLAALIPDPQSPLKCGDPYGIINHCEPRSVARFVKIPFCILVIRFLRDVLIHSLFFSAWICYCQHRLNSMEQCTSNFLSVAVAFYSVRFYLLSALHYGH